MIDLGPDEDARRVVQTEVLRTLAELNFVETAVQITPLRQFVVRSEVDDTPCFHYKNAIGQLQCR